MNCPRCKATIGPLANPDGIVTCPGCGSRLMTRSAAIRSQGGARAPVKPALDLPPPSATLPPTPAALLGLSRPQPEEPHPAAAPPPSAARARPAKPASRATVAGGPEPTGPARKPAPAAAAMPAQDPAQDKDTGKDTGKDTLAMLLRELHEVRALQERILQRLEGAATTAPAAGLDDDATLVSPIRARHQKTVVLIDDDPATRDAAVSELLQADVPVRAFAEGNAAVTAIAEEKPDVVVLELGLAGEMEGRDVINMIKSTMEWVDIPILLWTREPVATQKEARLLHGADELVPKSSGTAALVARVIALFRRVH